MLEDIILTLPANKSCLTESSSTMENCIKDEDVTLSSFPTSNVLEIPKGTDLLKSVEDCFIESVYESICFTFI